jgi:hypothetical protein
LPPGGSYAGFVHLAVLHYEGVPNAHPKVDPTDNIPISESPLVETNLRVRGFCLGILTMRLIAFYPAIYGHWCSESSLSACPCFGR